MEDPDSTAKKRTLPQWMIELGPDGKSDKAKKVFKKKRLLRSPIKQTVYCMNEEELVEVALEILSKVYHQNDTSMKLKSEPWSPVMPAEPHELSQRSNNAKDSALDDGDSSSSSPVFAFSQNSGSRDLMEEEKDDPMKFVREIFFN